MKASNLLKMIEFIEFGGNANLYFKGISFDTRTLKKGDLFFAHTTGVLIRKMTPTKRQIYLVIFFID